jgi:hypothetical protein
MSLNATNVPVEKTTNKYVSGGGVYEMIITDIEVKDSKNGESYSLQYNITVPVEGQEEGMTGRVSTSYVKEGTQFEEQEFEKLVSIARACSVNTSELPTYNNLKEAVVDITPRIQDKLFRAKVTEEWYFNSTGETRFNLRFPRQSFTTKEGEKICIAFTENVNIIPVNRTRLKFDPNNMYDVNKSAITQKPVDSDDFTSSNDDLPFN